MPVKIKLSLSLTHTLARAHACTHTHTHTRTRTHTRTHTCTHTHRGTYFPQNPVGISRSENILQLNYLWKETKCLMKPNINDLHLVATRFHRRCVWRASLVFVCLQLVGKLWLSWLPRYGDFHRLRPPENPQ
jgi:hypothetical protein